MGKRWEETREDLAHLVFKRGAINVARMIPASRSTVYRLLADDSPAPCAAIRQGIERAADQKTSQVRHSEGCGGD